VAFQACKLLPAIVMRALTASCAEVAMDIVILTISLTMIFLLIALIEH
jgi:hypothetical protein